MTGRLTHIYIAPKSASPMKALDEATLVTGSGIEGDRYFAADT